MNEKKHLKVIRMLETIAETATTSAAHIAHEEHESSDVDDGYSLYEAHPPTLRFSNPVKFFHPDADSMDSYGTITSQEILEAFEKASEELLLDSFTSSVESPPKASLDDDCLYTDLVHSASIDSTHV
ncbi:unnamed protein product [Cylicostephanus goldi]|uniref:Uncharacterized protein n=1 Tax=Cylicostephanus goldi TaxID=71465 RepID=A0A3P6SHH8_CYLGO|nr:unnamed protein product [Cylicostephanus goldi]